MKKYKADAWMNRIEVLEVVSETAKTVQYAWAVALIWAVTAIACAAKEMR